MPYGKAALDEIESSGTLAITGNATVSGTLTSTRGTATALVFRTAQASTSGTSIDFDSIPSWAKRITVMLDGVSASAISGYFYVRLGAGSILTTGYAGMNATVSTASNTTAGVVHTTGLFAGFTGSSTAASTMSSTVVLNKFSDTSNVWTSQCIGYRTNDSGSFFSSAYGKIDVAGTLDRLSVVTTAGNFDAGSINIMYE